MCCPQAKKWCPGGGGGGAPSTSPGDHMGSGLLPGRLLSVWKGWMGGGGRCRKPRICVPKMARSDFPDCKFCFLPRWSLWSGKGGGGEGVPPLGFNCAQGALGCGGSADHAGHPPPIRAARQWPRPFAWPLGGTVSERAVERGLAGGCVTTWGINGAHDGSGQGPRHPGTAGLYPGGSALCWGPEGLFGRGGGGGCIRREGAPEAVRWAVGGGCRSGWGRLLSVTNAIDAGTCRQGGQWLGIGQVPWRGGGGV